MAFHLGARRVPGLTALALLAAVCSANALQGEWSTTPTEYRMPVLGIALAGPSGSLAPLYRCAGATEADCMVDVADGGQLERLTLSQPRVIPAGTYDRFVIRHCTDGGFVARFRAQGRSAPSEPIQYSSDRVVGTAWTTDPALHTPIRIRTPHCVSTTRVAQTIELLQPRRFRNGLPFSVAAFLEDIVTRQQLRLPGDRCFRNACSGVPQLVAHLPGEHRFEKYYVAETGGGGFVTQDELRAAGAQLVLFVNTVQRVDFVPVGEEILAGFTLPYATTYSRRPAAITNALLNVARIRVDATDHTYAMPFETAAGASFVFEQLKRGLHAATYSAASAATHYALYDELPRDLSTDAPIGPLPACDQVGLFAGAPVRITPLGELDGWSHIVPLGLVVENSDHIFPSDHMYFYHDVAGPAAADLVAPGDIRVVRLLYEVDPATGALREYGIDFTNCTGRLFHLLHVTELSPRLATYVASPEAQLRTSCPTPTQCFVSANIRFAADEVLGRHLRAQTPGGLTVDVDWYAFDADLPRAQFLNPWIKYWFPNQLDAVHIQCPLDYLEPWVRTVLEAKVGTSDPSGVTITWRTGAPQFPLCGEYMQDVLLERRGMPLGGVRGNWIWPPGLPWTDERPHLALVDHLTHPDQLQEFSIGPNADTTAGIAGAKLHFTRGSVPSTRINTPFEAVLSDQVYCYQELTRHNTRRDFVIMLETRFREVAGEFYQDLVLREYRGGKAGAQHLCPPDPMTWSAQGGVLYERGAPLPIN